MKGGKKESSPSFSKLERLSSCPVQRSKGLMCSVPRRAGRNHAGVGFNEANNRA